jgi:hypothetical protein
LEVQKDNNAAPMRYIGNLNLVKFMGYLCLM